MLKSYLLELIQQGEGAKLEFKRDDVRAEALAKEIVAFSNMNGGQILLGVEDDKQISGIQKENLQEWLMDTVIRKYLYPSIIPDYEEVAFENKKVAVVTIPQGNAKPYVLKHNDREDIFMRFSNTCQLATRDQTARLFDAGGLVSAERFPVYGSRIAELDSRRYQEYFNNILGETSKSEIQSLLEQRSFLVGEQKPLNCSYFAYAMFAKSPQLRLPQAGVRVTIYPTADKDYDTSFDEIIDLPLVELKGEMTGKEVIEPSLHEKVISLLQPFISRENLQGMTRKRFWDYPVEVLRELCVNAFIHRDLTKQDYVRVVVYSDRLEIKSPGALPNGLTVEKIRYGEKIPRNPVCIRIFREYGYLENQGMGIRRKVIPLMKEKNGNEPDFEATADHFKVTLWKKSKN